MEKKPQKKEKIPDSARFEKEKQRYLAEREAAGKHIRRFFLTAILITLILLIVAAALGL